MYSSRTPTPSSRNVSGGSTVVGGTSQKDVDIELAELSAPSRAFPEAQEAEGTSPTLALTDQTQSAAQTPPVQEQATHHHQTPPDTFRFASYHQFILAAFAFLCTQYHAFVARLLHPTTTQKDNDDDVDTDTDTGRQLPPLERPSRSIPLFHYPLRDRKGPWLDPQQRPSKWWYLLYDILTVSVIQTFSFSHELAANTQIRDYLSFYVLIFWIWTSQTTYDLRYQANDVFSRLCKLLQMLTLVYFVTAAGRWHPSKTWLNMVPGVPAKDVSTYDAAGLSWKTVLPAYMITRFILALQYLVTALVGRKRKRDVSCILISFASLLASLSFCFGAYFTPPTSLLRWNVKYALMYMGGAIEVLAEWAIAVQSCPYRVKLDPRELGERYGNFVLIVLGEGLTGIALRLYSATWAFERYYGTLYGASILGVFITFLLWAMLFADFHEKRAAHRTREMLWAFVHLPLSFSLYVFLVGIANAIFAIGNVHSAKMVTNQLHQLSWFAVNGTAQPYIPTDDDYTITWRWLNRVPMSPPIEVELAYLQNLTMMADPPFDPVIQYHEFYTRLIVNTISLYASPLSDEGQNAFDQLATLALIPGESGDFVMQQRSESLRLARQVINSCLDGNTRIQWLLPSAMATLSCIVARALIGRKLPLFTTIALSVQIVIQMSICIYATLFQKVHDVDAVEDGAAFGDGPEKYVLGKADGKITALGVVAWIYVGATCFAMLLRAWNEHLHRREQRMRDERASKRKQGQALERGWWLVDQEERRKVQVRDISRRHSELVLAGTEMDVGLGGDEEIQSRGSRERWV